MNLSPDKARVVIAVPLATPLIYWRVVASILELEKPSETDLMVFQGALVDRARNILVGKMLNHPMQPTHLFFLDADIIPAPETLMELLKTEVPVVSALYRKRLPPYEPMAFLKRRSRFCPIPLRGPRLREVDIVGAGCLLIQREVLEKVGPPWFTSTWSAAGHLSEDFSFCEKVKAAKFKIRVDTMVRPLHLEPMGVGTSRDGVHIYPLE